MSIDTRAERQLRHELHDPVDRERVQRGVNRHKSRKAIETSATRSGSVSETYRVSIDTRAERQLRPAILRDKVRRVEERVNRHKSRKAIETFPLPVSGFIVPTTSVNRHKSRKAIETCWSAAGISGRSHGVNRHKSRKAIETSPIRRP